MGHRQHLNKRGLFFFLDLSINYFNLLLLRWPFEDQREAACDKNEVSRNADDPGILKSIIHLSWVETIWLLRVIIRINQVREHVVIDDSTETDSHQHDT